MPAGPGDAGRTCRTAPASPRRRNPAARSPGTRAAGTCGGTVPGSTSTCLPRCQRAADMSKSSLVPYLATMASARTLRVGAVPYLVGRPLIAGLASEPGVELTTAVPARLVEGLRNAEL